VVIVVLVAAIVGGYYALKGRGGDQNSAPGGGTEVTAPPTGTEQPPPPPENPGGGPEAQPVGDGEIPGKEEFRAGNYKTAAEKLAKYVEKQKSPAALYMLGASYLKLGKIPEAEATLERAMRLDPRGESGGAAALCLGDSLYARCYADLEAQVPTKWELTREAYSTALRTAGYGPDRKQLVERLGKLNQRLLWSPMLTRKDSAQHTVMPGESVEKIAVAHGLPRDCARSISRINTLKQDRISPGQKLKVIKPLKMEVVVSKSNFTLTAFLNGYFFGEFRVGIGKAGSTPTGEFVIAADGKDKNPNWTQTLPDGTKVIHKFGSAENILGTRWMGFIDRPEIGATGLGIHGTGEPESIGKASSAGCIRMVNKDVELLYDFTPGGTSVTIVK
jgi:LysM repeat protein